MIINVIVVGLISVLAYYFHSPELVFVFNAIAVSSVALGIFFFFGATVGILRFPDFYTRMHAAGKGDTLSSILILFGVAVYSLTSRHVSVAELLVAIKIFLIINFIFLGSPTACHAVIDAGYQTELKPWKKDDN